MDLNQLTNYLSGFFPDIVKMYNYTPDVCSHPGDSPDGNSNDATTTYVPMMRPQRMSGVEEQSSKQSEKPSTTKSLMPRILTII